MGLTVKSPIPVQRSRGGGACSGVSASKRLLVLCCTDPDTRMAPTRGQSAAVGAFDAQSAVERLEAEMTEIRGDICQLKQSTAGISEIKQSMVTLEALDALMQRYLPAPSLSTIIIEHEGLLLTSTHELPVTRQQQPLPTGHYFQDSCSLRLKRSSLHRKSRHPCFCIGYPAIGELTFYFSA